MTLHPSFQQVPGSPLPTPAPAVRRDQDQSKGNSISRGKFKLKTKIEVPSFNGKGSWEEFWDVFEIAVHRNSDLSDVEKMMHLKGLIKDDAKMLFRGLWHRRVIMTWPSPVFSE